jgi:Transposase DDE domain
MKEKWYIKNKKRYLKIHIAVNVKTKKILAMKVTADEHVHDSNVLPELVENIIESDSVTAIDKLVLRKSKTNMFRCSGHKHSYFNIVKFDGNLTIFH